MPCSKRSTSGWSPRRISVTPAASSRVQQRAEGRLAGRVQLRPALRLHHHQPFRPQRRRRRGGTGQRRAPRVAAHPRGDRHRHQPHVLDAAGMDAMGALARRLPLAAVDRALARLQRDIAAIGRRPDDAAAHLRADRRRHHPRRRPPPPSRRRNHPACAADRTGWSSAPDARRPAPSSPSCRAPPRRPRAAPTPRHCRASGNCRGSRRSPSRSACRASRAGP